MHHISDVLKLAFELALALILAAVVLLIAVTAWSAAHENGLVIEAFSVPPDLAARGITGQVIASKMLDRLGEMQAATTSDRPILLRLETKAGHGAGKPRAKVLDELTDEWSFVFWQLGVKI